MQRVLTLVLCLTLIACGQSSSDPAQVAQQYWAAVQQADKASQDELTAPTEPSASMSVFSGEMTMESDKVREIRFGEPIAEAERARVPTTIIPEPDAQGGSPEVAEISFDTQLVKVGGEWKVDKAVTDKNMMGAAFAAAMAAMGEAFGEGMKGAVEGIGEALTEGMQGLAEGLAEGMSEGLDIIEESANQLDSQAQQQAYVPPVVLPARVNGAIRGTEVQLSSAEWSNTLAIYEGDGWGFNPSLLIFLFLKDGELPEDRTITVSAGDQSYNNPHVHYRWADPENGDIKTEIVTRDYDLVLKLGKAVDRRVSGEIEFAVPGEATKVSGSFEIDLGEPTDS